MCLMGNLKKDFFCSSIDDLVGYLFYFIFYFQGELYINFVFLEMVWYVNEKGIYIIIFINGYFFNDVNVEEIV